MTEFDWKCLGYILCCQQKWGFEVRLNLVMGAGAGGRHMLETGRLQSFLVDTQEPKNSAESYIFSNNGMLNCILCWTLWKDSVANTLTEAL